MVCVVCNKIIDNYKIAHNDDSGNVWYELTEGPTYFASNLFRLNNFENSIANFCSAECSVRWYHENKVLEIKKDRLIRQKNST